MTSVARRSLVLSASGDAGIKEAELLVVEGLKYLKRLDQSGTGWPEEWQRCGYFGKKWNFWFPCGLSTASQRNRRSTPLKKFLMIGALAFAATTFAETAMAAEYYVVRDSTTKKCTVVESKPTSTTTTVVDNGIYKTKTEAETGMKKTKVCTE
jgi:hypothetical protein